MLGLVVGGVVCVYAAVAPFLAGVFSLLLAGVLALSVVLL